MLKTMWGETEELMFLFWSALFVNGRVMMWEGGDGWSVEVTRWEGSEVARGEEGSTVVKLERWESGEVRR